MLFDGRGTDGRIELGVSGLLFNNNLIMYDRRDDGATPTLYPQMLGKGVSGPRTNDELKLLPVIETTWRYWKQLYPETKVISALGEFYTPGIYTVYPYGPGSGAARDYWLDHEDLFFAVTPPLEENSLIGTFLNKDLVLGVRFGEIAKAYPYPTMDDLAVINDDVGGNPIVVLYYAAEQFAVPYSRLFEGQLLTFDMIGSNTPSMPFWIKDRETGTVWDMLGNGLEGHFRGQKLVQVPSHTATWFEWATFWQNTGIF
jgi:hypothetical protein